MDTTVDIRCVALQAALWVWKEQGGSANTKLAGLLDTADRIEYYLTRGVNVKQD